ncbi:MAG: hypothetical protein C0454_15980, partial [Parvibaculum sp.]|nr:hypothetical protein [Parvibaculum sp.]
LRRRSLPPRAARSRRPPRPLRPPPRPHRRRPPPRPRRLRRLRRISGPRHGKALQGGLKKDCHCRA